MDIKLDITTLDFDELTERLSVLEARNGVSTIDIFHKYLNAKTHEESDPWEEWIDTFLLYLGTDEIRQYSCPKIDERTISTAAINEKTGKLEETTVTPSPKLDSKNI